MEQILLLEDNPTDAGLIQRSLSEQGVAAAVAVAENREEFFQALDRGGIDLVISDSRVPGLTALDALQAIKTQQPHCAFIMVSGTSDAETIVRARHEGLTEYLPKSELRQLPPIARLALKSARRQRDHSDLQQENSRLNTSNRAVQRLVRAVRDLSAARNLATVQEIVRHAAREINGADGATFVLRDGPRCYYADEDAISPLWKGQRFPLETCISGWAMLNGQAAIVPDITVDARIPLDAYRPTFVKSLVMVPIRATAPIGAIGNYWAKCHTPSDEEVELIQALADSTSIALENVELYQQLEQRVQQRTSELQAANRSLEEFSYFISHDLRTPIRHIGAYADILAEELKLPPQSQARHALNKIQAATFTMNAMLEGLLSLATLSAKAIDASAQVDMTALAKQVTAQMPNTVEYRIADMPLARGNETLLRQVWVNLLSNAVKFSSARPIPIVDVGCMQSAGEQPRYFVRDNGVGFDMAQADRLFTAFRRLHSEREFPGIGVGLSIVHRIVTQHGGAVWAESKPGAGAVFYFTLNAVDKK